MPGTRLSVAARISDVPEDTSTVRAMNGILAAKALKEIPYCIVDESLWIGRIEFRKR